MAADKSMPEEGGFLSRWSQRKQALSRGVALAEPSSLAQPFTLAVPPEDLKQKEHLAGVSPAQSAPNLIVSSEAVKTAPELPPPPTMEDAHALTPQSDFKPFMRADVLPGVKNAAMKQLFKDPHFNVMDMMDIYVDDYSKPDPLPPEMLRKMAVTQFLGFWKEEEEEKEKADAKKAADENKAREDAQASDQQTMAQSRAAETPPQLTDESQAAALEAAASHAPHDHPDLQLQPNHAAGCGGIVQSAG